MYPCTCRKWIKTSISLTAVMGLTWITGVLVFDESLIPFAYVFTVFVAFQVTIEHISHSDNSIQTTKAIVYDYSCRPLFYFPSTYLQGVAIFFFFVVVSKQVSHYILSISVTVAVVLL